LNAKVIKFLKKNPIKFPSFGLSEEFKELFKTKEQAE
jgi:hypothetical protein